MVVQKITHYNPKDLRESHTKFVCRKVAHTTQTLINYAKHYKSANVSSINGRTKLGWPFEIVTIKA